MYIFLVLCDNTIYYYFLIRKSIFQLRGIIFYVFHEFLDHLKSFLNIQPQS